MRIGGLIKCSLNNYPGHIAAVIFTQGCNFRCRYCHNPELVLPECFSRPIPESEIFGFLKNRKGKLEGVVVTGGEPTIHQDLPDFIQKIKDCHFKVKLDTNGSHPEMLEKIISSGLIDFIAMDLKGPLDKYSRIIDKEMDSNKIMASICLIKASGIDYQFRTTLVKPLCSAQEMASVFGLLKGVKDYKLQKFQPSKKILDRKILHEEHFKDEEIAELNRQWLLKSGNEN